MHNKFFPHPPSYNKPELSKLLCDINYSMLKPGHHGTPNEPDSIRFIFFSCLVVLDIVVIDDIVFIHSVTNN